MTTTWQCQKCKQEPGGDWTQCKKSCPIDYSPLFKPETAARYQPTLKVVAAPAAQETSQ